MSSLVATARERFLQAIRSVNPQGRWKILVVDDYSQKLLGSVLKQFDILEENVTLIESISNHREPQQFEAVYILMPTTQNVERVIKDFSNDQPQYLGAHLFFIEGLSEPLLQRLASSPAEPFLRGLQELFLNFWAVEAQTFSLNSPSLFFNIYSPPRNEAAFRAARSRLEEELLFVSKSITNLCIALNEFPYIRYYFPSHHLPLGPLQPSAQTRAPPPQEGSNRWRTNLARGDGARAYEAADTEFVTKLLAFMVQRNLDEYKRTNTDFPIPPRPRGTLIITDRSMDVVAPLIHEFTYQAMCNDLLPIEDGTKYTLLSARTEDKTATLSEADTVWTTVRHMHMREAIDKLMADFNKFMEENAGFKGEGAASLNDMKDMLASLPQYQEQREKFSLHLNVAQECMDIFEKAKLSQVANVEQCCATGMTPEGKSPKTLVEEMVPLLDSREIINPNKVRMVALYILYRDGVPDEDPIADQDAVNSLTHLGVRITRGPTDRDTKKKLKQKPSAEEEYDLSRYRPLLRTVIEVYISLPCARMLFTEFPRIMRITSSIHPSSLTAKPSWHKAVRSNAPVDNRQRVIIFMAGGMTYSEIRECYALGGSLNKDIYIGSTHTITPRQFIDDLKVLELGGVGSRAIPNGIPTNPAHQSYQEYYDQKYFTPDLAPPQRPALAVPKDSSSSARSGKFSKPSPSSSYADSSMSVNSTEKKKKKKGFFHF
ncbi:Sec1-like snare protein [Boletus edulis]|nr:Sec1-like snare protein [Boletus edulis]